MAADEQEGGLNQVGVKATNHRKVTTDENGTHCAGIGRDGAGQEKWRFSRHFKVAARLCLEHGFTTHFGQVAELSTHLQR
jgi:hypothetical protein